MDSRLANQSPDARREPPHGGQAAPWLAGSALLVCFAAVYAGTVLSLTRTWMSQDEYSHGFLVPVICGYFVYAERERLRRIPAKPDFLWGGVALVAACLTFVLGDRGGVRLLQQLSFVAAIPSLVLFVLGRRFCAALAFPLAYLVLMLPVLSIFPVNVHWPLQLVTANLAGKALALFGVPVLRSGQFLQLPNSTLEVAQVCSGARFLLSILAVAIPLAFLSQKTWWRRAAVVVLGAVVGILTNGIRVAFIGLWTYYGGQGDVHGPAHILQGLFVSIVGYVFLFLLAVFFAEKVPARAVPSDREQPPAPRLSPVGLTRPLTVASVLLAAVLCYSFVGLGAVAPGGARVAPPATIGGWLRGAPLRQDHLPGADKEWTAAYRDAGGGQIGVYSAYFSAQRQGKEVVESESWWTKGEPFPATIRITDRPPVLVNGVIGNDGGTRYAALYWYDIGGRFVTNKYRAKLLTAWDAITRNRNNGGVMVVYRPLASASDRCAAIAELVRFTEGGSEAIFPGRP